MVLGAERLTVSGVEIELTQFGGGGGPALLYLHGGLGPDRATVFLEGLAQHFRVIAPTHPGFGGSAWPQHIRSVSDLAFFYLDLADHFELCEAVLVGACFGGWLAAEMLTRSTARFSRLVLIDALGAKFGDRTTRDITDIHGLTEVEAAQILYAHPTHAGTDYANLPDDALNGIARSREAFAYFGWKPYMHNPSLKHWLHRIDIPTCWCGGRRTDLCRPTTPSTMPRRSPTANSIPFPKPGIFHMSSSLRSCSITLGNLRPRERDNEEQDDESLAFFRDGLSSSLGQSLRDGNVPSRGAQ